MALTRQTQVLGELEHLAGKAAGNAAKAYRKGVIGPMVGRIKKAKSVKGLLRQLGPGLLRAMDSSAVEKALEQSSAPAIGVGAVSATPKEGRKKRRSDEGGKEG